VTGLSAKLLAEREAKLDALGPRPPWWQPFARRRWRKRRDAILAMDCSQMTEMLREVYSDDVLRAMAVRPAIDFGNIRGPIARHPGPGGRRGYAEIASTAPGTMVHRLESRKGTLVAHTDEGAFSWDATRETWERER
jgi:hypothetical protein